eukprot:g3088.t1
MNHYAFVAPDGKEFENERAYKKYLYKEFYSFKNKKGLRFSDENLAKKDYLVRLPGEIKEFVSGLVIRSFNGAYNGPDQSKNTFLDLFGEAKLDPKINATFKVHDFNKGATEAHGYDIPLPHWSKGQPLPLWKILDTRYQDSNSSVFFNPVQSQSALNSTHLSASVETALGSSMALICEERKSKMTQQQQQPVESVQQSQSQQEATTLLEPVQQEEAPVVIDQPVPDNNNNADAGLLDVASMSTDPFGTMSSSSSSSSSSLAASDPFAGMVVNNDNTTNTTEPVPVASGNVNHIAQFRATFEDQIRQREMAEREGKKKAHHAAEDWIEKFNEQRHDVLAKARASNAEEEKQYKESQAAVQQSDNPWEKVMNMIDSASTLQTAAQKMKKQKREKEAADKAKKAQRNAANGGMMMTNGTGGVDTAESVGGLPEAENDMTRQWRLFIDLKNTTAFPKQSLNKTY